MKHVCSCHRIEDLKEKENEYLNVAMTHAHMVWRILVIAYFTFMFISFPDLHSMKEQMIVSCSVSSPTVALAITV